jgi:hypothetical protein
MSSSGSRNVVSTILSLLLLAAIAGALVLLALHLQPDAPVRFGWGEPEGTDCPEGVGAPACFRFIVTNLGNRPADARCDVSAPDGGEATLLNGQTAFVSNGPVDPGAGFELDVRVVANEDATVPTPNLSCVAV